jgi:3-hydroxyacyl-CoA dehydrogenase
MTMEKTAIIGCGFIGRAWALSFARAGYEVAMWDPDSGQGAKALQFIAGIAGDLERYDLLNGQPPDAVLSRIRKAGSLGDALSDARHVQENAPEDLATKCAVFAELDRLAHGEAVMASSTSALLPSRFTENIAGRHRCLVVHPLNPPYLIRAVEVVPAPWTSVEVIERTRTFMLAAGQIPLVMDREIDGFIMNRMQGAVLEEAFRLVADGYATVEDIDLGIREGLAARWSFMGPFETIDLNAPGGVRDYVQRYQNIYERLFPQMQRRVDWAGPALDTVELQRRRRMPLEAIEERLRWRDRRLMALAAHKRQAVHDTGE